MKALIALGAGLIAMAAASPAVAREGCGQGFHRARNGMCRANQGTPMRRMEGRYYRGQGYWHQNRWYNHRRHRNGVWVYYR